MGGPWERCCGSNVGLQNAHPEKRKSKSRKEKPMVVVYVRKEGDSIFLLIGSPRECVHRLHLINRQQSASGSGLRAFQSWIYSTAAVKCLGDPDDTQRCAWETDAGLFGNIPAVILFCFIFLTTSPTLRTFFFTAVTSLCVTAEAETVRSGCVDQQIFWELHLVFKYDAGGSQPVDKVAFFLSLTHTFNWLLCKVSATFTDLQPTYSGSSVNHLWFFLSPRRTPEEKVGPGACVPKWLLIGWQTFYCPSYVCTGRCSQRTTIYVLKSAQSLYRYSTLWVRGKSSAAALLKVDTKWRRPWDDLDMILVVFFI